MNILTPFCLLNTIIILHLKTVYDKNILSTSVMRRKPSVSVNNHPLVSISHHPLGIYNSAVSGLWLWRISDCRCFIGGFGMDWRVSSWCCGDNWRIVYEFVRMNELHCTYHVFCIFICCHFKGLNAFTCTCIY